MKYEERAYDELLRWQRRIRKKGGKLSRLSKTAQNKMNQLIPEKVHNIMTDAIKSMVNMVLSGSNLISKSSFPKLYTLEEKEKQIQIQLDKYRKAATVEGAGTGAGGLMLGLADFPLLLSIKLKFLHDVAKIHHYDLRNLEERFSFACIPTGLFSDEKRIFTMEMIENWEEEKQKMPDINWQTFQQEYRDYIDIAKMLQLIPGFGAVVGAYANYKLLDKLGETAIFAYRMRYFSNLENIRS